MQNEPKQNATTPNTEAVKPSARHAARRYALQAMYQWQVAHTALADIEQTFLQNHLNKETDTAFFKELIHGIPAHQAQIDEEMKPFLSRSLTEIDPVELAVLRLAIYEFLYRPDIHYRIIINEALELTKKFGSIEGFKFVNGVLDRVAKKIRVNEINMEKNKSK